MKWDSLSTVQIDRLDRKIPVILNIAAIEQHGPHLPLSTDADIGAFFLDRLDAQDPNAQLILPQVKVGCSDHHLDYPGTLSASHTAFADYVEAILDSVVSAGFRNIIVLNSHGGNQGIGQVIIERFGSRHRHVRIVLATWWNIVREDLRVLSSSGQFGTGHACELETSIMLAAGQINLPLDIPEGEHYAPDFEWSDGSMLYPPSTSTYRTMRDISGGNGVVGSPATATKEKGEEIAKLVVARLSRIARDIAAAS